MQYLGLAKEGAVPALGLQEQGEGFILDRGRGLDEDTHPTRAVAFGRGTASPHQRGKEEPGRFMAQTHCLSSPDLPECMGAHGGHPPGFSLLSSEHRERER